MIYIGIDPGKKGGYALVCDGDVDTHPWDDEGFVIWLIGVKAVAEANDEHILAAVEKVGAMPGNGSVSMFNFGKSAGYIEGVLTALGIPYQLVPPRRWKAAFSLTNDKGRSIEVCKKLFPGVDLKRTERCKVDSDGKAEALLIAEWGRRNL